MRKLVTTTIILITILGLILRIQGLITRSFWFDESFSYFVAKLTPSEIIKATAGDNHPPLYYLLLHYWLNCLENSPQTLRMLSVIFGVFSIPIIFLVGKRLHSTQVGIIASLMLALSPLHVYYSQETRMYAFSMLVNLLLFFSVIEFHKSGSCTSKTLYVLSSLLGLYTHYYFALSFITANLLIILLNVRKQKKIINWLLLQSIIIILFLPWLYIFQSYSRPLAWKYSIINALPATFAAFAMGGIAPNNLKIIFFDSQQYHVKLIGILASLWLMFLFSYGMIKSFQNNKRVKPRNLFSNPYLLSASFVIIPITLVTFVSLASPIYSLKSFAIFLPNYLLAIAVVVSELKPLQTKITVFGVCLVFLISITIFLKTNPIFWGSPINIVSQETFIPYNEGDAIAHASIYSYFPFRYYHKDKLNEFLIFNSGLSETTTNLIGGRPFTIQDIEKSYNRIWFVGITFLSPPQDVTSTVNYLSSKYQLVSNNKHDHIEIYEFKINKFRKLDRD
jgi:uncharacterized membrane protein